MLERGSVGDTLSRLVDRGIVALIVLNLVSITLQSVPKLSERYGVAFAVIETVSLLIFTLEYALRIWSCTRAPGPSPCPGRTCTVVVRHELARRHRPARSTAVLVRVRGAGRPESSAGAADPRFLKLARYSPGMRSLLGALYAERRALAGCFLILIGATLLLGLTLTRIRACCSRPCPG
jgi:voltage-gated potassium channel